MSGGGDEVVTKLSARSVEETVSRLGEVVTAKGMKVFAVIDHSGEAEASGLELRDTKVVIFGGPLAGTPVMAADPLAAPALPLKVLVWADGDQTKVSYTAPAALAARYGLSDELAHRLAGIDAVTDAATHPDIALDDHVTDAPAHRTEANRRAIREAFDAWRDGTGAITDAFAPEMVWRIEGHSLASREYGTVAAPRPTAGPTRTAMRG